jgi:hypothetical protein
MLVCVIWEAKQMRGLDATTKWNVNTVRSGGSMNNNKRNVSIEVRDTEKLWDY